MRALAALIVDRHNRPILHLDQVKLGNQPEPIGRQSERAGMDALVVTDCIGLGQLAGRGVNPTVNSPALDRVSRLRPLALHPFEIRETRAILELVDHSRRNIEAGPAAAAGAGAEVRAGGPSSTSPRWDRAIPPALARAPCRPRSRHGFGRRNLRACQDQKPPDPPGPRTLELFVYFHHHH